VQPGDVSERLNPEEESANMSDIRTISVIIDTIERMNKYLTYSGDSFLIVDYIYHKIH